MKIRHDSVFISSVLFTIALLSLVPWCWRDTLEGGGVLGVMSRGRHDVYRESLDIRERMEAQAIGDRGIASLTIICIGLIVILAIRVLIFNLSMRWIIDLFHGAIYGPDLSTPRVLLETMLIFASMLIALSLPKSFLKGAKGWSP